MKDSTPNYITPEGAKRLQKELGELRSKQRPVVVQDVADAAAQGDRSENAEYIYGKKKLREIDRRMHWLTRRLESATVVGQREDGATAAFFGAYVEVEDGDGIRTTYRIVGEDEIDLAPLRRPLAVLERAVLAALTHAPPSPRAALAAIALDPRRCRYILSAMPTWKGRLTGARLARVLRSHAGALSAAARSSSAPPAGGTARTASIARWTDRRLSETEAAIAIAVGDLTCAELVRRLVIGSIKLDDGVTMAAGVDARTAIDGAATFLPLVEYGTSRRTKDAAALALWMLLEELDRVRAPSLIASAIDGLSVAGSVVAPAVCEALATLERRSPGRLENVHAQSPRGRATVASAIARAYRAFGGMRDEG